MFEPELRPEGSLVGDEPGRSFAEFICRLCPLASPAVAQAAELLCRRAENGHTCLNLNRPDLLFQGDDCGFDAQTRAQEWGAALRSPPAAAAVGAPGEVKPLILDSAGRLYLWRYWKAENLVARQLHRRSRTLSSSEFPPGWGDLLRKAFPLEAGKGGDRQRLAAHIAFSRGLAVISGGPGTGKTFTLARILLLLSAVEPSLRFRLAAPTGKAAARLTIALAAAQAESSGELGLELPRFPEAVTLHRLLGIQAGPSRRSRATSACLEADVVMVDEASMVDLSLLARLLEDLRDDARLILVGDMHQLASVEPGYVLGDICRAGQMDSFSPDFWAEYQSRSGLKILDPGLEGRGGGGLGDSLVRLTWSHRFPPKSRMARLSRAVNEVETEQDVAKAWNILAGEERDATLVFGGPPPRPRVGGPGVLPPAWRRKLREGYGAFLRATDPGEALRAARDFRVLTALRRGPTGSGHWNRLIEKALGLGRGPCYDHRLLIVTRNDYELKLFNGDIGVILRHAGSLNAYFETAAGDEIREIPVGVLPEHDSAFALTIHKAQGSEFSRTLLLFPEIPLPFLTRELIYTGLTRAREQAEVWCGEDAFREAIRNRMERTSGLAEVLLEPGGEVIPWPSPRTGNP